eukprot:m.499011 g.499011  ORF g.499011 m.499011 type:complete len:472 (-) comp21823_c0_seq3:1-1416(-)
MGGLLDRWLPLGHRQRQLLLRREFIAYGACALFLSTIHNLFLLYHIELFVSGYKIDESSFFWGSVVFLVWNALNDFLLGWLTDGSLLDKSAESNIGTTVKQKQNDIRRKRTRGLAVGGPLMGLSFLSMLFPWPIVSRGLQYAVSLCVYDTCLTWVDLSHSSLLAELANGADERSAMSVLSSAFSASGSLSVFVSFMFWSTEDLNPFRQFLLILVVICSVGFASCSHIMNHTTPSLPPTSASSSAVHLHGSATKRATQPPSDWRTKVTMLGRFLQQAFTNANLMWCTLLMLIQTFHCHFNSNFFPLILGVLLRNYLSPMGQSLLLGVSFFLPHLNNIYFNSLVVRHGSYTVIKQLLVFKVVLSVIIYGAGPDSSLLLCAFVASNRVFTEGVCKLLNLYRRPVCFAVCFFVRCPGFSVVFGIDDPPGVSLLDANVVATRVTLVELIPVFVKGKNRCQKLRTQKVRTMNDIHMI